ncbi:unnamed protein product [Cuscuta europaea]|uniref:Amidohydrolase 3 domain-containing protein n=1 Tax=Cuscuta europaea TaxID=41803 RepID=A0A9P0YIA5_CUSEU|nr:unnamed protein product [Cuscuta europaea]
MDILRLLLSALLVALLSIASLPLLHRKNLRTYSHFADLVVRNATIYTSDETLPFADSMAIRGGRILRVGTYSSIQELVRTETKQLNVEGKVIVPGFIDSHVHFISGGLQVWLSRMDGHMGLANSLALSIAGISQDTQDINGGAIMKDSDGEPTGLVIDSAMKLVLSCIPEPSIDERRNALLSARNLAVMRGVTTVVDFGRYFPGSHVELPWEDLSDVYQWADSSGNMVIRVCLFFPLETWARLEGLVKKVGHSLSQRIHLGGVKAFSDGSLGSNSALFYEPYADEPHNYGLQVVDMDQLYNMTLSSDKSNLQVAIHAIGDRANDLILDMYASVASENQKTDRRFRIEHAQHLATGTAARFGEQAIFASVQPDHILDDADSAIKKLGRKRAEGGSYLFKSLLANNAQLAFGSDWPVADINPLGSIETAMKRITSLPGRKQHKGTAWIPSERLSLKEALDAYTISAARACFLERDIGSLSPGKLADFVVLSAESWDSFFAISDGGGSTTTSVQATYVGGIQAYPMLKMTI